MGGNGKGVGGGSGRKSEGKGWRGRGRAHTGTSFFPLRALAAVYFSRFLFWRCHGQVGVKDFRSA